MKTLLRATAFALATLSASFASAQDAINVETGYMPILPAAKAYEF